MAPLAAEIDPTNGMIANGLLEVPRFSTHITEPLEADPRSGSPFTSGLAGPGAIAGEWDDMSAEPAIPGEGVAVCATVDERIEGPGGIWLQQKGVVVPPPAGKGGAESRELHSRQGWQAKGSVGEEGSSSSSRRARAPARRL